MSIEAWLKNATSKSEALMAADRSIAASEAEIKSRLLEMSPKLNSELYQLRDHRESLALSPALNDANVYKATLTMPFFSGTTIGLSAGQELIDTNTYDQQNIATWEAKITQALWRNAFGTAVRANRRAAQAEMKAKRYQLEFDKQNVMLSLESLFWDLSLALREEEIRQANSERSETLQKWVRGRAQRSAAESTDLLQAQALAADRRLQLIRARNRIAELRIELGQAVPGSESLLLDLRSLESDRNLNVLTTGKAQNPASIPQRLDALATQFHAKRAKEEAVRSASLVKPQLDAYVSQGTKGIDSSSGEAWSQANGNEYTATQVGVVFSMELDRYLTTQKRLASEFEAESQTLLAQAKSRSGALEWADLSRNITNLKVQVEEAKQLAAFQRRKSSEERRRYQLGRSTAFQAISFEVEAAEAELRVYQLLAQLRKMEARARLFSFAEVEQ